MFTCDICNKDYNSKRSLASHKNHHNPEYHHNSKQGALSSQKKASLAGATKIIAKTKEKYSDKKCLQCNNYLSYKKAKEGNKFCNNSCSAKYNNPLKPKKDTIKTKRIYNKNYVSKVIRTCEICDQTFTNRNPVKTCSPECKGKLLSKSISKSFEDGRHKGNQYRSRSNPSYMERTFSEWLKTEYPDLSFETEKSLKIIDHEGNYVRTFYVDFFFECKKLVIELDGTHHKDQLEYDKIRDNLIEEQYGYVVLRISQKEYREKSKIDLVRSLLTS